MLKGKILKKHFSKNKIHLFQAKWARNYTTEKIELTWFAHKQSKCVWSVPWESSFWQLAIWPKSKFFPFSLPLSYNCFHFSLYHVILCVFYSSSSLKYRKSITISSFSLNIVKFYQENQEYGQFFIQITKLPKISNQIVNRVRRFNLSSEEFIHKLLLRASHYHIAHYRQRKGKVTL